MEKNIALRKMSNQGLELSNTVQYEYIVRNFYTDLNFASEVFLNPKGKEALMPTALINLTRYLKHGADIIVPFGFITPDIINHQFNHAPKYNQMIKFIPAKFSKDLFEVDTNILRFTLNKEQLPSEHNNHFDDRILPYYINLKLPTKRQLYVLYNKILKTLNESFWQVRFYDKLTRNQQRNYQDFFNKYTNKMLRGKEYYQYQIPIQSNYTNMKKPRAVGNIKIY